MPLPKPPPAYEQNNEAKTREQIDRELGERLKRGQDIDGRTQRIIMQSPDGNMWVLGVSNAGTTTWTAL